MSYLLEIWLQHKGIDSCSCTQDNVAALLPLSHRTSTGQDLSSSVITRRSSGGVIGRIAVSDTLGG